MGNADFTYDLLSALAEAFGGSMTREYFDEQYFTDELYSNPNVKGFSRCRLGEYVSAALSLAGTAATFLAPSNIFQYTAFGTTLTSTFVLVQSLFASGWYDALIDPTDASADTLEEVERAHQDVA
jgi:hypothetical protein